MTTTGHTAASPTVTFIATQTDVASKLLAQHHDDGSGHCRVCTSGPYGARHVWPCSLRMLAEQARTLMQNRRSGVREDDPVGLR